MIWAPPRRILWLLAAATLIPIGVLSGLGVWILRQDRDAEQQRQRAPHVRRPFNYCYDDRLGNQ